MSSSSVEGLRQRLAAARAQRAEVEAQREALREADALKKLQDDHDALAKEVETARSNGDALTETLTSRKEYIQNAPSETQLLKLERRLETVKQSLAEVHKSTEQLNTGIDAYRERSRTCSAARRELASDYLEKASKSTLDEVLLQCEGEKQSKSSESILQAIDALIAICEDRESVLLDLNQQYSAKLDEDAKISARIADLHSLVEAELPRLEAEADRFVREITAAWTREKHALTEVYEKLYAVNKEQQYHLQRGTHVKPAPGQTTPGHELALSARHARLSAQLIEARERLGELNAENAFTKRVSDQLRHEGRDSVQRFELLRQDVQDRLKLAQQERGNAEEESRRFRNLKADLQDALQAIRETPSGATKTA